MSIEMLKVGEIPDEEITAVSVGLEYNNELIFGEVSEEDWIMPEKNIAVEEDEDPIEAAVRLMSDKIGAVSFVLKPLADYKAEKNDTKINCRLFYAKVERFDSSIDEKIGLTYFKVPPAVYEQLASMKGEV